MTISTKQPQSDPPINRTTWWALFFTGAVIGAGRVIIAAAFRPVSALISGVVETK